MASWFWIALGISVLALAGCTASAGLPSYGLVGDFALTDQSNHPFQSADSLRGKVWIADFIFTNCAGPCPRMSAQMRQVQAALLPEIKDLRLVSFSVDPARDTPEVLAQYAQRYQAEPGVWFFLTGSQATLNNLARNVFLLGDVNGDLQHSTRFALIDRQSRVRGYYLTSEEDAIPKLIADAKRVAKDRF
ncbi:MAG TPA: SCO family protein [Bryobacteraceae bacterium]|jgi:protein SCO1/2|nr:SCO family protein [Bryobacteraceae bacterium]